jgi:hypothetical protein
MATRSFGVKEINLIGQSVGTPTIESPGNLNIQAATVAISTNITVGGQVTSNVIVGTGYSVGIGTTTPRSTVQVIGDVRVGLNTTRGVILTSPNGTSYRLIVNDAGVLSTSST